jgi:hypothetical protein
MNLKTVPFKDPWWKIIVGLHLVTKIIYSSKWRKLICNSTKLLSDSSNKTTKAKTGVILIEFSSNNKLFNNMHNHNWGRQNECNNGEDFNSQIQLWPISIYYVINLEWQVTSLSCNKCKDPFIFKFGAQYNIFRIQKINKIFITWQS